MEFDTSDFFPIPYYEYNSFVAFLHCNMGLDKLKEAPLDKETQTEHKTEDQSTQTKKKGLLWGYFST